MKKEMPILKGKYAMPGSGGGSWNSEWLIRVNKHQQGYKQRITLPVLSIGYKSPLQQRTCTADTKGKFGGLSFHYDAVITVTIEENKTHSKLPQ